MAVAPQKGIMQAHWSIHISLLRSLLNQIEAIPLQIFRPYGTKAFQASRGQRTQNADEDVRAPSRSGALLIIL